MDTVIISILMRRTRFLGIMWWWILSRWLVPGRRLVISGSVFVSRGGIGLRRMMIPCGNEGSGLYGASELRRNGRTDCTKTVSRTWQVGGIY